jgi:hypothetical protein
MSVLKVHRELTPDCFFRHARGSQSGIQGFPWKRESITLTLVSRFRGDKSGFPLKDCGNDNFNNFNIRLFMQRLGLVNKIIDACPVV